MKTLQTLLCGFILQQFGNTCLAAVLATPITPYRSLADSPWYRAIADGDALTYYSHTWDDCDPTGVGTLPDGLGVYEDFEACGTPWVSKIQTRYSDNQGVDADDGDIDGQSSGNVLVPMGNNFTLVFSPTTNGKLPQWFGFVSLARSTVRPPSIEILGLGGNLLERIQLTDLNQAVLANPPGPLGVRFQGFIVSQEITAIRFLDGAVIDHFQYGYGAAPIPEPSVLALTGLVFLGFKRRR